MYKSLLLYLGMKEKAIFAAGCFWGVQTSFDGVPGVLETNVGYTGGKTKTPTYEAVCGGDTGHAEALEVMFDNEKVTYETLVRHFFKMHNPTEYNRQGPDVGSQYRSAVFFLDNNQKTVAEKVMLDISPTYFPKTIATEVAPFETFYKAEEYHQKYFEKNGGGTCHV